MVKSSLISGICGTYVLEQIQVQSTSHTTLILQILVSLISCLPAYLHYKTKYLESKNKKKTDLENDNNEPYGI